MSASLFLRSRAFRRLLVLALLLLFGVQSAYVASRLPLDPAERAYRESPADGPASLVLPPAARAPLVAAAARLFVAGAAPRPQFTRLPFVLLGLVLAASVAYIAERWYGKRGGFMALALFALSPQLIATAAHAAPTILAALGAFGLVVTSLAVAHTLYAPREVILWNWRRILLLAVSVALGLSANPAVIVLLPLGLLFLFYLVPSRRGAAVVILAVAALLAAFLLLLSYRFHASSLAAAAQSLAILSPAGPFRAASWLMVGRFLFSNGAGFTLLLVVSLLTYAVSGKARYFGNTSSLITAAVIILTALLLPHAAGFSFLALALPFLLLFVTGISTDWLESRWAAPFAGLLAAVFAAQAYFCLAGLWQLPR